MSLHHQIVNGIDFRKRNTNGGFITKNYPEKDPEIITGRDVFTYLYVNLKKDLEFVSFELIEDEYSCHYKRAQEDFGHYFRNLYRIIKLVDETDFNFDNKSDSEFSVFLIKYKYTSIIRAQISDYELLWLFYNCISKNGRLKFKPLIEKYSVLKNISFDELANEKHRKFYNESAYKKLLIKHADQSK